MTNIILVGMPGAGKSTIGVLLAKAIGYDFLDTDLLIQAEEGMLLQEILDKHGDQGFLKLESHYLQQVNVDRTVIATGGSVVFCEKAMANLQQTGPVVWLHLGLAELQKRLDNLATRGVVMQPGQTLLDVYEQRNPLYERYSDIVVVCDDLNHEQIVATITAHVEKHTGVQLMEDL